MERLANMLIGLFQKKVQKGGYSINDRKWMNVYKSIQRFQKIADKIRWEDLTDQENTAIEKAAELLDQMYDSINKYYCLTPDCIPELNQMITNAMRPLCNICRKFRI